MPEQSAKIAVIDNDKPYRDSLRTFLESEGFNVVTASSGKEGRKILKRRGLDLAIVDIRLVNDEDETDRSGLELVKLAQRSGSKVSIIMLTNFPSYPYVIEALRSGTERPAVAADFVDKSDGPQAVLVAIEKVLKAREQPDSIFASAQKQERILFWLRNIMAVLGMALIFVAVIATIAGVADATAPGAVTAVILNAIAILFGRQHRRAEERLEKLRNN